MDQQRSPDGGIRSVGHRQQTALSVTDEVDVGGLRRRQQRAGQDVESLREAVGRHHGRSTHAATRANVDVITGTLVGRDGTETHPGSHVFWDGVDEGWDGKYVFIGAF